jgi:predicted nuclease with TOPRIM domain
MMNKTFDIDAERFESIERKLDRLIALTESANLRERVTSMEMQTAALATDIAHTRSDMALLRTDFVRMNTRFDRLDDRLARIEKRLELVEA